jgi:hypothetical protein
MVSPLTRLLLVLGILIGGATLLVTAIPLLKYLVMIYFCILIYSFVRDLVHSTVPTVIISAILIYVFVINLYPLLFAAWFTWMLITFGIIGIIMFALQPTPGSEEQNGKLFG